MRCGKSVKYAAFIGGGAHAACSRPRIAVHCHSVARCRRWSNSQVSFVVNAKHDVLYLGAVERGTQPPWSGENSPAAKAAAQRDVYEACESLIAEQTQYFAARADFVVGVAAGASSTPVNAC